jgi:hypothetical protein
MRARKVAVTVAGTAAVLLAVIAAVAPGSHGTRSAGSSPGARPPGGGPPQDTLIGQYTLTGVSCASPAACTAVGEIAYAHHVAPAVLRWSGKAWSVQHAVNPATHGGGMLAAVSCPRPDDCIAVGVRGGYQRGTLAERWNGKTWSVQPTPMSHTNTELNAVACSSPVACTAVGDRLMSKPPGNLVTVAMRWNGKTWALQSTPNSPTAESELFSVSCPAVTACTAIGSKVSVPGSGQSAILAAQWNGRAWKLEPVPKPAGGPGRMRSVACASATYCVAVGVNYAKQGMTSQRPASVVWNGSSWKLAPVPYPQQATDAGLFGVSCTAATSCAAVGNYTPGPGGGQTMADRWNGTTWTRQYSATPPGFPVVYLSSVSCPASGVCIAVGIKGQQHHTLAERWDGSAWVLTPTP